MMRIEMIDRLIEQEHAGFCASNVASATRRRSPPRAYRRRVRRVLQRDGRERGACDGAIRVALPAPEVDVRMAADEHAVEHRRGNGSSVVCVSRPSLQRERATRPIRERLAIERDRAARRRTQARERVQGQRLARAVTTENRGHRAGSWIARSRSRTSARPATSTVSCVQRGRSAAIFGSGVHCLLQPISLAVLPPTITSATNRASSTPYSKPECARPSARRTIADTAARGPARRSRPAASAGSFARRTCRSRPACAAARAR